MTKACTVCKRVLPLTAANFWRDKSQTNGFKPRCKDCSPPGNRSPKKPRYPALDEAMERGFALVEKALSPRLKWPNVEAFDREEVDEPEKVDEKLTAVEEHRLRKKVRELEILNKALVKDLSDAQLLTDVVQEAIANPVPGIEPRERTSGLREGTALAMASDWHIDEVIEPGQVSGRNRYNPAISARRMERFFESVLWAINSQRDTFDIRDLILWLGGDLITNFLHDDNILTNAMSPPEAIAYAKASIADGIRFLLTDPRLERIVIPCNDGNHGRMSKRMGSSSRTMMSLEIMLYRMLAQDFAHEPRVQFIIAEGEHVYLDVYGRTIRFAHGDSIKYSGGIGGITIPIMKALASWNTIRHADLSCIGHFHQRLVLPDLMVNGSLIGYGPFSLTIRARFEPPSQNFSILEPKRFRSVDLPLWVSERDDDSGY